MKKYYDVLARCPLFEGMEQRELLSMDCLGVERSAMSAEISRLRREGVIECVKSRFKIL